MSSERIIVPNQGPRIYDYTAKCVRVVDGDTVDLEVDLGFGVTFTDRFRLFGIDAPEIRGDEREDGLVTTDWLFDKLYDQFYDPVALRVVTIKNRRGKDKRGKYGRWLVVIQDPSPEYAGELSLNEQMVSLGLAVKAEY